MSKNWNKKRLHNQLDSMFSDLDDSSNLPGLSMFNQINGWVWEIDPDGTITKCNPEVEDLLGFKCETLINQPISQIADIKPHLPNFPREADEKADPERFEIIFYYVDGKKIKTASYIAPRFNENEVFLGWSGITLVEEQNNQLGVPEENFIVEEDLPAPLDEILSQKTHPDPVPDALSVDEAPFETQVSLPNDEEGLEIEVPLAESEELPLETAMDLPKDEQDYIREVHQPDIQEKHTPKFIDLLRTIDNDPERVWESDEIQLVEEVQSQLELALENANLFQQTQRALAETDEQARRLRLLNELSERLTQATSLMDIYDISSKISNDIFGAESSFIATWGDDSSTLEICAAGGNHSDVHLGQKVSRDQQAFYQPTDEFRILISPEFNNPQFPELNSIIAGPIYASGEKLGTLLIGRKDTHVFDKQDESFMSQLLSILNSEVENRKLFEAIENALATTEEQARRLGELNKLSEMLSQAGTFQEVITSTMKMMDFIIPCKVCQSAIWREDLNAFVLYDLIDDKIVETSASSSQKTIINAVTTQKKMITENNLVESLFEDAKEIAEAKNIGSMIAAPLLSGDKAIGAILVGSTKDFAYSSKDETLLQSISSIMVSTMENRRLFNQIQRRSIQLETSAEVSRIASTILDPSELLPEVVELIKKGFNLYYAGIFLVDGTGEFTGEPNKWAVLQAGSGMAGQQMLEKRHKLEVGGESMIGTSISRAEARIALDVDKETIFFRNPNLPDTRSEMALPLISRGQVLGALSIQSNQEGAFSPEDITSLQTLADQLANAIENAHLFEQTEERAEELTILNEMARAYTQTMDVDMLIKHTYEFTSRLMNSENFYTALFYPETNTIEFKLFVEAGEVIPPPEPFISLGEGLTDWIIKNQVPVLMQSDVTQQMTSMGIMVRGRPADSWLGVPMLIGNKVLGVIAVQSYDEELHFDNHDLDLLSAVASQAAVAIDNALRFQQTQARAKYEQVMREITTRVHSSTNAETILKTAVQEVSSALGRQAFIELKLEENGSPKSPDKPQGQDFADQDPGEGQPGTSVDSKPQES